MHLRCANSFKHAHHVQKCGTRFPIQPLHKNKVKTLKPHSNFGANSAETQAREQEGKGGNTKSARGRSGLEPNAEEARSDKIDA